MSFKHRFLILIIALTVMSIACDLDVRSLLEPAATVSVAEEGEPEGAGPAFAQKYAVNLPSAAHNLDRFDSYRAEIRLTFDGRRGDREAGGEIEARRAVDRRAGTLHRYQNVKTNAASLANLAGVTEWFRIADKIYITNSGETIWFEAPENDDLLPETIGLLNLDALIILPQLTFRPPQTDTLDGEVVRRYSFTEQDLAKPGIIFERAEGEVWINQAQNYLAQYTISATIRALTPIPEADLLDNGHLDLTYRVSQVDADLRIMPPVATTTNLLVQLPRPVDARITAIYPTLIEYTSAISPVSVTRFYQRQLTPLGWTQALTTVFEEKARLGFSKDDQAAMIVVTPLTGSREVKVVLSLQEQ